MACDRRTIYDRPMKTWFITGVSRGLGHALTQAALDRGDTVVGTVRNDTPSFRRAPGILHILPLELADAVAVNETVGKAFELCARIDVLVNNAGYGLLGAIEEATDAEMSRLVDVNLVAPMRLIRAALPFLRSQGSGHIINISSIAARSPYPGFGLYAAAKGGIEAFSEILAVEVAPFGVKVTAVAPGVFRTDFLSEHSVRRSAANDAYGTTVNATLGYLDSIAGQQPGDPVRGAAAILMVVDAEKPPLHMLLGSDALQGARATTASIIDEMDRWEAVTIGTDFPKAPGAR